MRFGKFNTFAARIVLLSVCSCAGSVASFAQCPVVNVMVQGDVENPPHDGVVRVQLIFSQHSKDRNGESGEVELSDGSFRIRIPFLTQSNAPVLALGKHKCDLRPKTVVVTLVAGDREFDRVSLDWATDFKMSDPTAYDLQSKLVLHGAP